MSDLDPEEEYGSSYYEPEDREAPFFCDDETAPRSESSRRFLDFDTAPSALWESLIKSGYREVYGLDIEGIPFAFGQRRMMTTRGQLAVVDDSQITISYGLAIREGDSWSAECNREEGLASGRAIDFCIGRQQLADEGLGPLLFARPSLRATLTEAVTDPNQDWFAVDSTTSWDADGLLYIGRECVRYSWAATGEFGACIRGIAGYPHYHTASTLGAYAQCTDTPVFWRGRLVTLWAHLVSPEGRFLGDRWNTLGEWCRQEWRGFVRDAPRPEQGGMALTCLPLTRLAAQEFGAEIQGRMLPGYIVSEPQDTVMLNNPSLSLQHTPNQPILDEFGLSLGTIITLDYWAQAADAQLVESDDFSATFSVDERLRFVEIRINETEDSAATTLASNRPLTVVEGRAWFLEKGPVPGVRYDPQPSGGAGGFIYKIPIVFDQGVGPGAGAWIVMEIEPSADWSDADYADSGLLALESNGALEVVAYDRRVTDNVRTAFRLSARGMLGTTAFNLWTGDTKIRAIAGARGGWLECLRTLMTSSGMGTTTQSGPRGVYDTLPHGFGLGLPDDWIASNPSIGHQIAGSAPLLAATTSRTSIKELLCGWLALSRHCLVQKRDARGRIVLDVISTDVVDDATVEALTVSDVLLDGHDTPEMIEAPNHVRIGSGDFLRDGATNIVRDAPRAQAEGVRAIEMKAPGITREQALQYGGEMILLSDGQAAVKLKLPPWYPGQIGDSRDITSAHPAIWDWATGTYAPASVLGRAVEHGKSLFDGSQSATFLLAGQAQERVYLAPCATVLQRVDAFTARVSLDDLAGIEDGDQYTAYVRGDEDATEAPGEIDSIEEFDTYAVMTFDNPLPDAPDGEIVITFGVYDNCNIRQRRHMFVRSDRAWR